MSQDSPRVYRLKRAARRWFIAGGSACLIPSIGLAAVSVLQTWNAAGVIWMLLCLLGAWYGAHLILSAMKDRVALYDDAIVIERAYRRRRIARADITGYRMIHRYGPPVIWLQMRGIRPREILLPQYLETDAAFLKWFEGLA